MTTQQLLSALEVLAYHLGDDTLPLHRREAIEIVDAAATRIKSAQEIIRDAASVESAELIAVSNDWESGFADAPQDQETP